MSFPIRLAALKAALLIGMLGALAVPSASAQQAVRIGVIEDLAGPFSDIAGPGVVAAAEFAIQDFGGKVLGRPVELLKLDHQHKADIAAARAREWYQRDNVGLIVGLSNSGVAVAVRTVARDLGKMDIVSSGGSSELTGKLCSPTGFHWTYDSYSLGKTIGGATVKSGGDTWFFITADYAFGHSAQRDTTAFVEQAGGKVLGSVKMPLNSSDVASFLLQAQASKAKIVGLAVAGSDMINSIKGAADFGLVKGGQRMAAIALFVTDVHSLGAQTAQGLLLAAPFYWDQNDDTRAWSNRFYKKMGKMPTFVQAGSYSAVLHYLKAMQAAGTDDPKAVSAKMRALPVNDFWSKNVKVREDGRVMRDTYLFQVKSPAESKGPWDLYKQIGITPADQAYKPLSESECAYIRQGK